MQLVIEFIFYLCVYSTCFERQAPIIRSPLTVHTASSFLCLCLSAALSCKKASYKTVPQTDTNTETGGCMYG
jgi:hypothetical protein